MKANRKLLINIISLAIVVVIGVASVFIVLASLSANINSSFTINYKAKNVNAAIAGGWVNGALYNDPPYADVSSGDITSNQKNYIVFDKSARESQGSFDSFDLEMTPHKYVGSDFVSSLESYIYFVIFNFDETPISLTIDYTESSEHITTEIKSSSGSSNKDTNALTQSGQIQTTVPYAGYSTMEECIEKLDTCLLSTIIKNPILGFAGLNFKTFCILLKYDYNKFLDLLWQVYQTSGSSGITEELIKNNWATYFSEQFEFLKDMPSNEETFNFFKNHEDVKYFKNNASVFQILSQLSPLLSESTLTDDSLLVRSEIIPPKVTIVTAYYKPEADNLDSSISGTFNFSLTPV